MLFEAPQLSEFLHLSLGHPDSCCWKLFHVLLMTQCNPRAFAGEGRRFARTPDSSQGRGSEEAIRQCHFLEVFSCWVLQWPLPGWCFGADISTRNGQLKALLPFWPECEMQQMGLARSAAHKSLQRGLHVRGVPQFHSQNVTKPRLE